MHETGHSKPVQWDNPEGWDEPEWWDGEEAGRGVQDGEHMWFMSMYVRQKPLQYYKVTSLQLK